MANINKDFLVIADLKTSKVTAPPMVGYNTDRRIFNIFLKLQITMSSNNDIKIYVNNEEASDYKVKLTVIKPRSKQVRYKDGILMNTGVSGNGAVYQFDLGEEFTDQVGSYICELKVICDVNGFEEIITCDSFTYTIKASAVTGLNEEIISNPELPVLESLIKKVDDLNAADISEYQKKSDQSLQTTDKTIIGAINEVNSQVKDGGNGGTGLTEEQEQNLNASYTHSQSTHAPSDAEKNIQSDWNITDTNSDAYIKNKPVIPNSYTLPIATSTTLGGIKVGAGLSINAGVLSANGGGTSNVNVDNILNSSSNIQGNSYNAKPIRPLISFTDDDGKAGVYTKWKPILEEKGIPLNICVITGSIGGSYLTWEQIRDLQDNYGCEILSHTVSHTNIGFHEINKTWIEELRQSKLTLMEQGLNVRGFAYPNGGMYGTKEGLVDGTANGYWMTGLFYDYGIITDGLQNTHPLKNGNMGMSRVGIGCYEAVGYETLDGMKAKVDECFANNTWLIFMTHVDDAGHNEEDTQNLRDLIDYIKTKNIDIVTLSEGFEIFGNVVETPNCKITKQGSAILDVTNELPNATKYTAGIVQVGDGINAIDGVISVDNSLYYSKEYLDNVLDTMQSDIENLKNNQGGEVDSSPAVSSISAIKTSPGTSFNITYVAVDSDGIQLHELSVDNGVEYTTITPTQGDNNTFTYSTSITKEGVYYYKLKITDTLGNLTIKSFSVTVESSKIIPDKVTTEGNCVYDGNITYTLTDSSKYDNFMWYDTKGVLVDTSKTYKLCIKTIEKNVIDAPVFIVGKSWIIKGFTDIKTLDELVVGETLKKEFTISQAFTPTERIIYVQFGNIGTASTLKIQMWIEG